MKVRESKTSARRSAAAERAERAFELRKAGLPYTRIAQELHVSAGAAFNIVNRYLLKLRDRTDELAESVRQIELSRLDSMLEGLWERASGGNTQAIDRVLKIMQRRADLLGLDAPTKADVTSGGESLKSAIEEIKVSFVDPGEQFVVEGGVETIDICSDTDE